MAKWEGEGMTGKDFRKLIYERSRNARLFAQRVGLGETMISHIIHGRRRIPYAYLELFARALKMEPKELEDMLKGGVEYDSKTGCRCFRLKSEDNKKVDTIRIPADI